MAPAVGSRRIIVAMPKGGSGKTATAVAFARGLERAGKTVLLVDLDPQGSATAVFGVSCSDRSSAADLFVRRQVVDPVQVTARLHLVPSPGNDSLDVAAQNGVRLTGALILRDSLTRVAHGYDYVVCDCAPNLGPATRAALASGPVLVPVETTRLAVAALPRLARVMAELGRTGLAGSILAYLATRYVSRQTESREALATLRAVGRRRVLESVVPQSTAVARSLAEGVSLFDERYRASKARSAYLAAIDEVVSRLEVRHE
jgi:chromosome partitioning protein